MLFERNSRCYETVFLCIDEVQLHRVADPAGPVDGHHVCHASGLAGVGGSRFEADLALAEGPVRGLAADLDCREAVR